jgi:Lrp/AsnC family transcriptional regulator, regulator for asnA, asnC and gidA
VSSWDIDSLDQRIILLLQDDGRASNVDIGRALGVAEYTVRKRIDRLLQGGIIRVVGVPELHKLGWPVEVLISLQVAPGAMNDVARGLGELAEVRSVCFTTGEYQIVAELCLPSEEALHRFLSEYLAAVPGVVRMTTASVLHTVKSRMDWRFSARMLRRMMSMEGTKILVVDDDPDFVEVTRIVLQEHGYQVITAANGTQAMKLAAQERPAVILLDVMMSSVLEGVSVTDKLSQDAELRNIPVIMVSSIAGTEQAGLFPTDQALAIDAWISKPVVPAQLLEQVERVLSQ